jgi:hypothetical protein
MFRSVVWRSMTVLAGDLNTGFSTESRMEGSYELCLTNNVQPIMAAEGSAEKTLNRTRLSIYFDTSRIVSDSVLPHFHSTKPSIDSHIVGKSARPYPICFRHNLCGVHDHRPMGKSSVCHRTRSRQNRCDCQKSRQQTGEGYSAGDRGYSRLERSE